MNLITYFRQIRAPRINAGASEADIAVAEARLGGRFPDGLRVWFGEANGFEGETEHSIWRFNSLDRLQTIAGIFQTQDLTWQETSGSERRVVSNEYVVFCDALIYLPFYAVNIRRDSPRYAEVLLCLDHSGPEREAFPVEVCCAIRGFGAFADWLFTHPDQNIYDGPAD